jgi:hypothetical protein
MSLDPRARAGGRARDRHVDERPVVRPQTVESECREVGKQGVRAVGQHCGDPVALAGQPAMADGVHTSVHAVQAARPRTLGHRLAAQPKPSELGKGDDSMPGRCEVRQSPVERGSLRFVNSWLTNFCDALRGNCARRVHAPTVPHPGTPVGYERYETMTTP